MLDWINKAITEADDKNPCIVKITAYLGSLSGFGLTIYDVVIQHAHFDIQAFGIGLGAMLGAVGAALKLKPENPKE